MIFPNRRKLDSPVFFIFETRLIHVIFNFQPTSPLYCITTHVFLGFSIIGVLFDAAVCYLGKNLDLYGAQECDRRREFIKEDETPQTADGEKKKEMNGNL